MGETAQRFGGWLLLIALSMASVVLAAGAGADELVGTRRTATVQIRSVDCDGVRGGTGVIIDGAVVTNRHVVAGAQAVEVTFAGGDVVVSESVAVSPVTDVAVVRLADAPRGAELAAATPRVGDDLVIAGHPGSMPLTEQRTDVDAVVATGLAGDPSTLVRGDTLVVAGHSGSPAFNADGEVAALVYASEYGSQRALMIGSAELGAAIESVVPQAAPACE